MPPAEREEIAPRYKQMADFDPATVNERASWSV
jgi:hypothetical protein